MGRRLNWEAANRRDLVKLEGARSTRPLSVRPMTDAQRRLTSALARQCGVEPRFYGTTGAASLEINRLKALLAEIRRHS